MTPLIFYQSSISMARKKKSTSEKKQVPSPFCFFTWNTTCTISAHPWPQITQKDTFLACSFTWVIFHGYIIHLSSQSTRERGHTLWVGNIKAKICFLRNVIEKKKSYPIWLNNPNIYIWQIKEKQEQGRHIQVLTSQAPTRSAFKKFTGFLKEKF